MKAKLTSDQPTHPRNWKINLQLLIWAYHSVLFHIRMIDIRPTPETEKNFAASHFSIPFGRFYNLWKWICLILQFFGESSRAFPRTDQHREKNLDRSNFVTAGKPKGYKPCHLVKNDICMKCVQVPRRSTSCGTARKTAREKLKKRFHAICGYRCVDMILI